MTTTSFAAIAGRMSGTAARTLIWAYREINWCEVGAFVLACVQVLIVALLLAGGMARRTWAALPGLSERLGKAYARFLVGPATAHAAPSCSRPEIVFAPAVPSRRSIAELEALSCRQLMALSGTRRKLAKRHLIAMVVAMDPWSSSEPSAPGV